MTHEELLLRARCLEITNHGRDRIERLYNRMDWLERRIKEAESIGKVMTYDKAELSALRYVLQYMADADMFYYLLTERSDEGSTVSDDVASPSGQS